MAGSAALAIAAVELAETGVALAAQPEDSLMPPACHLDRIASYTVFVVLIAPVLAEAAVLRFPQYSLIISVPSSGSS